MIIGICGFIGSGKDTVADYLVNFHGFRRESFASTLKDAVSAVFGWDRTLLEGRSKESRDWREQIDPWWSQRLGQPITPRYVLQYWGTDVIRKNFHQDIWIASLENKLRSSHDNIVITDCRFPNEISGLKNQAAKILWIQRGKLPEWYHCALTENTTDEYDQWLLEDAEQLMEQRYPKIHHSEWAWVGTDFDHVIDNNGSIEDLYAQIKNQVLGLRDAK
jgi:hypothetical protein